MPTERLVLRLQDIRDNVARIETYTADLTLAEFEADPRTVDAVERCLERISEAARKLGPGYDDTRPDLDLPALRALGNRLRHECDRMAPRRLWAFRRRLAALDDFARQEIERLAGAAG
jgi:uncharacterized protein with HEPN domain